MPVVWNNLGSFDALYPVHEKDEGGNAVDGEYLSSDGQNNLIHSEKLVSTIGVSDLAVIDTPDVLMICQREMSQSVRKITDFLAEKGDERVSLQYHNHRSEPWVVVRGEAEVTNGDVVSIVKTGESTFIPKGCLHRLANESDEILEVIEVQQGDVLTEEDIVRVEDDYRR